MREKQHKEHGSTPFRVYKFSEIWSNGSKNRNEKRGLQSQQRSDHCKESGLDLEKSKATEGFKQRRARIWVSILKNFLLEMELPVGQGIVQARKTVCCSFVGEK